MKVYWHVLLQAALKFMWDWPHDFYPKIQGQENAGWWLAFVGGGQEQRKGQGSWLKQ